MTSDVAAAETSIAARDGYASAEGELPGFGPASTYVAMPDAIAPGLAPFDWYVDLVLAGAEFHGFPDAYRAALAAQCSIPDPDSARAAMHAALLAELRRHAS